MTPVFFNLIANASLSLLTGWLLVSLFIWFFRITSASDKTLLLSLPFIKLIYDVVRGVPKDSILFSEVNPFSLPYGSQFFSIGAGISKWGPNLSAIFTIQGQDGQVYAASLGDYLMLASENILGLHRIKMIVISIVAISVLLCARHIIHIAKFERNRLRARDKGKTLEFLPIGYRTVDIYVAKEFRGTPFTGGFMKPYICFPYETFRKLDRAELIAVCQHELSHVRRFDLLKSVGIKLLGDLFWFVPGYRKLSVRIDELREIAADKLALKYGASPDSLASALLKISEKVPGSKMESEKVPGSAFGSAFLKRQSLVVQRVEALLEVKAAIPPRFGWGLNWLRFILIAVIFTTVMFATFGGNHQKAITDAHAKFSVESKITIASTV